MLRLILALLFAIIAAPALAQTPALADMKLQYCDRLTRIESSTGTFLCWRKVSQAIADLNANDYTAMLYRDGVFSLPANGKYAATDRREEFYIEQGNLFILANTTRLGGTADFPVTMVEFYDHADDGGQRVYFCEYGGAPGNGTPTGCAIAPDGEYKTIGGTAFTVQRGFLWDPSASACRYERDYGKEVIACENRD